MIVKLWDIRYGDHKYRGYGGWWIQSKQKGKKNNRENKKKTSK